MFRRALFAVVLILVCPSAVFAFDPPTRENLANTPPTFQSLIQVQLEREKLFPEHLAGREASLGSKVKEAVKYWRSAKTGHDAVVALQNAIKRNESTKSKVFSVIGKGDFDAIKARLERLDKYFGNLDKALDAFESNQELPQFSVYSEYQKKPDGADRFFSVWEKNLELAFSKYTEGAQALQEVLAELQGKGWLNDQEKATVESYVKTLNEIALSMSTGLEQTKSYVAFEKKCDDLREYFGGQDVAFSVVVRQIENGASFRDWLDDYLQYGPAYPSQKLAPKNLEKFYKSSLDMFNQITIKKSKDANILRHIDSAYRTVFLRLQAESTMVSDFRYIVQQRQLAKNGMTNIREAYVALAKKIGCKDTNECTKPEMKGLFAKIGGLFSWVEANPLEAEALAAEIGQTISILKGDGTGIVSGAIDFLKNAQARRLSGDFVKSAIFGDYDPLVDPKQSLSPELIALTHLVAILPYAASIPISLFNQNLASTLTNAGAYLASLAVGGPIPVAMLATIKVFMGFGQVKAEQMAANLLSGRADANALMTGILAVGSGSNLKSALQKAAAIYLAKHGTRLFGNAWTNLREGRSNWKNELCKASVAAATGLYAWCQEGVASGLATAYLVYCSSECTLWSHHGTSSSTRALETIDKIAENMHLDPGAITQEAQKAGGGAEYDKMISTLTKNDPTQKENIEKALDALFSGQPFLFGGFGLLTSMAAAR